MLKLALIENLRRLADEVLVARAARRAADAYVARIDAVGKGAPGSLPVALHTAGIVQLLQRVREYGPRLSAVRAGLDEHLARGHVTSEDAIRSEHQRQAAAQVSVANVITSLRLCSTLDWSKYFEAVSLVERVLQRDPAGVHARMDFLSRDRYRQAVEELADATGEAQVRVALRAVESARQAAEGEGPAARAAHVGYHLIGRGRRELEADVAFRPGLGRALSGASAVPSDHRFYLGSIALVPPLACSAASPSRRGQGGSPPWVGLRRAAPAPARQRGGHRLRAAPGRSLRAAAAAAAPRAHGRRAGGRAHHGRRAHAADERGDGGAAARAPGGAGARQPRPAHPLRDPRRLRGRAAREAPGDAAILAAARDGVTALNARLGGDRGDRFFLFHRARQWNPARASGWAGSASAARSRSSTACCAAPRTRASPCRSATSTVLPASATASRSTPTRACRATRPASSSASSRTR